MNMNLSPDMAPVLFLVVVASWIATIVVHVVFAGAVHRDGVSLNDNGMGTVFASPFVWALAVLLGGVFVAVAYWVIHHSEFRRIEPVPGNPGPRTWGPPGDRGFHTPSDEDFCMPADEE